MFEGCWGQLHPDNALNFAINGVGRPFRLQYRPEIYMRDRQAGLYEIEKENIEIEKKGGLPTISSPIVLWH